MDGEQSFFYSQFNVEIKFNKAFASLGKNGGQIHVQILFLHRFILYLIMNLSVVKWKGKKARTARNLM